MSIEGPLAPKHHSWTSTPKFDLDPYRDFQNGVKSLASATTTVIAESVEECSSLPSLPLFVEAQSHAIAEPEKVAIIDKTRGESFTYLQLLADVAALKLTISKYLEETKLETPRVAFLAPSGYDYVVAQWAIWASSAIAVPLCTSHPLKELQYTISDSDPSLILLHPAFQKFESGLRETAPSVPLIPLTSFPKQTSPRMPTFTASIDPSGSALIIYTSGTTSRPKGCVTTHETIHFQALSLVQSWKYTRSDHLIHVLPLHHVHGIINGLTATLLAGGVVEMHPKFDAKTVWDRWSESGSSTMFMAVPTVYGRLVDFFDSTIRGTESETTARRGVSALRLLVSGSAALPVSTKRKFAEISGHELLERYGMTEIGMGLSCGLETEKRIDGCVGWPLEGVQVRLVEESSGKVVDGEGEGTGQVEIRGPNLFKEYFRRPKQTEETFTEDGWFKTGDMARRDQNGAYFILGRESVDIIKSGGYKISALEVERKILENSTLGNMVAEVVVVGIEDADWGQRVAAVIVQRQGTASLELAVLRASLKEDMAPYKIPSVLKIVDAIERNAMGKVNKKQILKKYWS